MSAYSPESITQREPLDIYREMMAMAETKSRAAQEGQFGNDERVREAWQREEERLRLEAARYILGLVGKAKTEKLRAAVTPESLKAVLIRAGAGYETLMMIGEGTEELRGHIEERRQRLEAIRSKIETLPKNENHRLLEGLMEKIEALRAQLTSIEEKDAWAPEDALRHRSLERKLEDTLASFERSYNKQAQQFLGQSRTNPLDTFSPEERLQIMERRPRIAFSEAQQGAKIRLSESDEAHP